MRKCRIVLFFGMGHQFHRAVAYATARVMRENAEFNVIHVNVDLTLEAIRTRVLEFVYAPDSVDVFVPIGLRCSVYLKQVLQELALHKTVIFAGVRDPVSFGLVDSYAHPGANATAVTCDPGENTAMAQRIVLMKDYISKVILPYETFRDGDYIHQQVSDTVAYFRMHNVPVEPIQVSKSVDIVPLLKERVRKGDAVLLLESAVGNIHEQVAYLCWEREAILCADGFEAIETGAVCALGIDLYEIARGLATVLKFFWFDKRPMGSIPVVCIPNKRVFVLNIAMLRAIGLPDEAAAHFRAGDGVLIIKKWVNCPTPIGGFSGA